MDWHIFVYFILLLLLIEVEDRANRKKRPIEYREQKNYHLTTVHCALSPICHWNLRFCQTLGIPCICGPHIHCLTYLRFSTHLLIF